MLEDARFALRTLVKRRGASLLLVSTLALGLAANAVIFNVLDAVVLRAFSFPNQERLVRVHETGRDFNGIDLSNVAPANLLDWQAQTTGAFSDLVGLLWWDASLRGRESAERIQGYRVGPSFFEALGVAPIAGRGFLAEEAREGQHRRRRPRSRAVAAGLWRRARRRQDDHDRHRALRRGRHRAAGLPVSRGSRGVGAARAAGAGEGASATSTI